jgi:hypothetical protein
LGKAIKWGPINENEEVVLDPIPPPFFTAGLDTPADNNNNKYDPA